MNAKERAMKRGKLKLNNYQKALLICTCAVLALLIFFLGYLWYVVLNFKRIDDYQKLEINKNSRFDANLICATGERYTVMTQNLGFGAYSADFDFFMDGGTRGTAISGTAVYDNIAGCLNKILSKNPDFVLFQEIDKDSTRSYYIDELDFVNRFLESFNYSYALNYDKSPYFILPPTDMHGTITAGLALYSKYPITESIRMSLPIMDNFNKYLDLDRCYTINRIPVENGKELIIYNVHLSAYGSDDSVREGQTNLLIADMTLEYNKGNYIICGGDFNHDLRLAEGEDSIATWAYPFPRSKFPSFLKFSYDLKDKEYFDSIPNSCRQTDKPYEEGVTETFLVDGFIVSDNIEIYDLDVLNTGFLYSDHEPVYMTFELK